MGGIGLVARVPDMNMGSGGQSTGTATLASDDRAVRPSSDGAVASSGVPRTKAASAAKPGTRTAKRRSSPRACSCRSRSSAWRSA
ncbi:hypothetical protein SAMN05444579_104503 [Delftia tsuruhatensis]|nr:hypothetical protein SAMN05444579_104503 [Delftia tsuruhatensis]